jgi:MSHA biogenesis protein MshQ
MFALRTTKTKTRRIGLLTPLLVATLATLAVPAAAHAAVKLEGGFKSLPGTSNGQTTFESVTFSQTFDVVPVVIAVPADESGSAPADIKIRNVTTTGFDIVQAEPPGEDGQHAANDVAFLAIEPGVGTLSDGTLIQAGFHDTTTTVQKFGGGGGFDSLSFDPMAVFDNPPAVLAHIQTMNNESASDPPPGGPSTPWITAHPSNVTTAGFDLALERAEVDDGSSVTATETIGWVAINTTTVSGDDIYTAGSFLDHTATSILYEARRTADVIDGWDQGGEDLSYFQTFAAEPRVVATLNTRDGADGGWLRAGPSTAALVNLRVDEDRFNDGERDHTPERAGFFAFSEDFTAELAPLVIPEPSTLLVWTLLAALTFTSGWRQRRRR